MWPGLRRGPPRPQGEGQFVERSFSDAVGARDYKLFEPARDGRALPLVVMLHGCTQNADDFARGTRMNALAEAHGVRMPSFLAYLGYSVAILLPLFALLAQTVF